MKIVLVKEVTKMIDNELAKLKSEGIEFDKIEQIELTADEFNRYCNEQNFDPDAPGNELMVVSHKGIKIQVVL